MLLCSPTFFPIPFSRVHRPKVGGTSAPDLRVSVTPGLVPLRVSVTPWFLCQFSNHSVSPSLRGFCVSSQITPYLRHSVVSVSVLKSLRISVTPWFLCQFSNHSVSPSLRGFCVSSQITPYLRHSVVSVSVLKSLRISVTPWFLCQFSNHSVSPSLRGFFISSPWFSPDPCSPPPTPSSRLVALL